MRKEKINSLKNPKGGRPARYEKNELLDILNKYVQEHPNRTIKLFELEAATGIKRYVWTYNAKDEIDKINREIQKVSVVHSGIDLPSVEQILTSCKGDEKKLAIQIQTLIDLVQDMSKYQDAAKAIKVMKTDYENKIDELECSIKEKDKKIDELYTQINKLVINSENLNRCREQGIKSNVIEFNNENREKFKERAKKLLL